MGMLDKVKSMLGKHSDQAKGAVDKGGDAVDKKTGSKYSGQVDRGQDAAKKAIDDSK
ncbi:MAG: antitoxin [Jatrophihabitans sp.]